IEQAFGKVCSCSEELHLLAHNHRRNAARNRAIISQRAPHNVIVFKLDRTRIDRHFRSEVSKAIGETRRVPDRKIWLRSRTEIIKRLQVTKTCLGHQRASIIAHAADRLSDPGGISCEELIVFRRSQKTDDTKLDYKIIDDLLCLLLSNRARSEIPLEKDVQER